MQWIIYGVDPCPWCGSQFRVVDLDQPNLIQCDDCRHDEKIDPSEVTEYERERLEKMKRELLTASQLANLFRLNGLGEDSIKLYVEAITLPLASYCRRRADCSVDFDFCESNRDWED